MIEIGDEIEVEMGLVTTGTKTVATAEVTDFHCYEGEEDVVHIKIESPMLETYTTTHPTNTPIGYCKDCDVEKVFYDKKSRWKCVFCEVE